MTMNLRAAAIVALVMFLGAQGLPAYRGFGGTVTGWQLTTDLVRLGRDFVTHPSEVYKVVTGPESFGRMVVILGWSGIAANGAMVAALCLGLLHRTGPTFVAASVAASVAAILMGVLTWDGAHDIKIGGWLWTVSIMWLFAAASWQLRQQRRRAIRPEPPG